MQQSLVTVFGGSGFLGRYVVKYLVQAGWRVRVAVRHPDRALFLKPLGDVGQITLVQANLRDKRSVVAAVAGSEAVVNLVGVLFEKGSQRFSTLHAAGAKTVAAAARDALVHRLVHISAIGADARSEALYARSKAAGESAVTQAFPGATILRPSVVFGPEDNFFNRFAALARLSPILPLINQGQTRFQPVYVGDVAQAVVNVLADTTTKGRVFELGGPHVYTLKQILTYILQETGRSCFLLPLPKVMAQALGFISEYLPVPPLTRDQLKLLDQDNIVAVGMAGLKDLDMTPTSIDSVVPAYLARYRRANLSK